MPTHYFKIGKKNIGRNELFFSIEEGQANLGDFDKAKAIIDIAASTGADAIEFQFAIAKDIYVKNDPGLELYLKREFSLIKIKELLSITKKHGMEFVVAPLSHRLVELLTDAGCSAYNINASNLTNPDIIDAVVDSNLPFFLSIPLATEKEIDWVVKRINNKGKHDYMFLHGQHTMASGKDGVDVAHTSLGYISTLKKRYGVPVGFIDHTPYIWMPAAAVAAGADCVTKHLAISRGEKGPDWHICLEPDEMTQAVSLAKKMKLSIETVVKKLAPGEELDRSIMRKSIVALKTIPVNKKIERKDLAFKRPGTGLEPSMFEEIIGKIAGRNIRPDEQLKISDLWEGK